MEKYAAVSRQVMEVLRQFTDAVEPVSIDEAFLDVTGSRRLFASSGRPATGEDIARSLKAAIQERTQLTASVGVAASKMVAKVASDMRKPDGLVVVPPGTEAVFLAPLPVRRLWGVGPKMEEVLLKIGVRTIGELDTCDTARLQRRLGTHGHDLVQLALGIDGRDVVSEGEDAKSIGQEHTFGADTSDRERLRTTLLELCDAVARRLRQHGIRARTITLKYRDEDFQTSTRAKTLEAVVDSGDAMFEEAWRLFRACPGGRCAAGCPRRAWPGRRRGRCSPPPPSRSDVARDLVEQRFGGCATRASLLAGRASAPGAGREGNRDGGTVRTGRAAGRAGNRSLGDERYFLRGRLFDHPGALHFTGLAAPSSWRPRFLAAPFWRARLAEARGLDGRRRAAGFLAPPPGSAWTAFLARSAIVPAALVTAEPTVLAAVPTPDVTVSTMPPLLSSAIIPPRKLTPSLRT
jgi:DNA polymerase-4